MRIATQTPPIWLHNPPFMAGNSSPPFMPPIVHFLSSIEYPCSLRAQRTRRCGPTVL
jgi:hypothetical protein